MKGMTGCSSFSVWSRVQAVMARVSAFAASSEPWKIGLASSRYQSQKTFQTNRYSAPAASSNRPPSMASDTARSALVSSPRIQRLIVCSTVAGSKPSTRAQPFIWLNRAAFHSLVPKLR